MDEPTIDHRGPEFSQLTREILERLKGIFKTSGPVLIYPTSGTGASEAALVNCLSPGDRVLLLDHGFFASNWGRTAEKLGLEIQKIEGDWRTPVDPDATFAALEEDARHQLKAVLMVHNETSTGVCSRVDLVRAAIDRAAHPALLIVDTISSLGSINYRHQEWGVDVTVGGSQKGLMLPPGLGFNALSEKALDAPSEPALAEVLLGLGCRSEIQSKRLLSLHTGHQSPLWFERGSPHVGGRGTGPGF